MFWILLSHVQSLHFTVSLELHRRFLTSGTVCTHHLLFYGNDGRKNELVLFLSCWWSLWFTSHYQITINSNRCLSTKGKIKHYQQRDTLVCIFTSFEEFIAIDSIFDDFCHADDNYVSQATTQWTFLVRFLSSWPPGDQNLE